MASGSKKVIIAALIGNSLIAVTKFMAAAFTGSSAMISEGIHSLVDVGNQVLLLFGLKQAKKPADERFPFGHGKEIYFWSFVVALLLFALGSGLSIYEGLEHIKHPGEITAPIVNFVVLGAAILFEAGSCYVAIVEFNKSRGKASFIKAVRQGKDPALFVVLFEDIAAMSGLLVALIGLTLALVTGNPFWDGVASVGIGLVLGLTAVFLAYETKGLLIGEAANPEIVRDVREKISALPEVTGVNEVLTLHMGPDFILVTISADFENNLPVGQIEKVIQKIDQQIKQDHPLVKRVFIEAEAASTQAARTGEN
ncbi:MAG: cation transporter [Alphaproteobacteria bacterium]|nr:cation transporter [Alphaproteobacteria bacterium]MCB9975657.1 cation transporter [Rhodospirillales bacterium]